MPDSLKLSEYVDEDMLIRRMRTDGIHHSINCCDETARELARASYRKIHVYTTVYLAIPESEFRDQQIQRYIFLLLAELEHDDRKIFVAAQFPDCIRD